MEAIDTSRPNGTNKATSPWEAELLRRWAHLQEVIAETDYDLAQTTVPSERSDLEATFYLLKRVALSVWVDARRIGLELPSNGKGVA